MTPLRQALVRRPPRSYHAFYAQRGVAIDLALADRQHAAYVAALVASGLHVTEVPTDEAFPDAVFIEDTGVVWNGRLLVTRMIDWREGEQAAVRAQFTGTHQILSLPDGARLDGGDVLHTDDVTYVGLSGRTNSSGAEALREFLAPSGRRLVTVPLPRCLHLKTAATWLGNGTMLVAPDLVDASHFAVDRVMTTAPGEANAANTLRIGTSLLYRRSSPATGEQLKQFSRLHGLTARRLDLSEFEKGDGSLTCLSIIF